MLLVVSATNVETEQQNKQHTFLVKTDLTKEQVETLLSQYHHKKNNQTETTSLRHKNSTEEITQLHLAEGEETHKENTTQFKAKKEKHEKKIKKNQNQIKQKQHKKPK